MAKKEKIAIHRDKAFEPIDLELDAAMGTLDDANKHITELLTALDPTGAPASDPTAKPGEPAVTYAEVNEDGEPVEPAAEAPKPAEEPKAETQS